MAWHLETGRTPLGVQRALRCSIAPSSHFTPNGVSIKARRECYKHSTITGLFRQALKCLPNQSAAKQLWFRAVSLAERVLL